MCRNKLMYMFLRPDRNHKYIVCNYYGDRLVINLNNLKTATPYNKNASDIKIIFKSDKEMSYKYGGNLNKCSNVFLTSEKCENIRYE